MCRRIPRAAVAGFAEYHKHGSSKKEPGRSEYWLAGKPPPSSDLFVGEGWAVLERDFGLNLTTEISDAALTNLLEGLRPDFDRSTKPTEADYLVPPMRGVHAPGIETVFAMNKGGSLLATVLGSEMGDAITAAHLQGVHRGLAYQQQHARTVRIKINGVEHRLSGAAMLMHLSTHHTARGNAVTDSRGTGGDPHIHTHVVIPNAQHFDGKWRGMDTRGLVHTIIPAEALYRMTTMKAINDLGIATEITLDAGGRRDWKPVGMDDDFVRFFSTRSQQVQNKIRQHQAKTGKAPTLVEKQQFARETRNSGHDHDKPEWEQYIDAWVASGGKTPTTMPHVKERRSLAERKAAVWERLTGATGIHDAAAKAGRAFHDDDASFSRYLIPGLVLSECLGDLDPDEAEEFLAEVLASDEFVVTQESDSGDPDYDFVTTRSNLQRERATTAWGMAKGRDTSSRCADWALERAFAMRGGILTFEQREAVRAMAQGAMLTILEGEAGTGKTMTLNTLIDALMIEGLITDVVATAVAGTCAQDLGAKTSAKYAGSIDGLVEKVAQGFEVTEKTLVLVDESVMMNTIQAHKLMEAAGKARIVFIGDPQQLQAIGAAGIHVELADRLGASRLTEVFRQTQPWYLDVCRAVRAGAGVRALELIRDNGGLHYGECLGDSVNQLLARWDYDRAMGLEAADIIIATDLPNVVIDEVNSLIQQRRHDMGELTGEGVTIMSGDYERIETFYANDLVALTKSVDGNSQGWVRNGEKGRIESVYADRATAMVRLRNRSVEVPLDALRLNYAGHAVRTQGAEAKAVYVLAGSWQTDATSAYSMVTRGKDDLHVFTSGEIHGQNPIQTLGAMWSEYRSKRTADHMIDIADTLAHDPIDHQQEHDDIDTAAWMAWDQLQKEEAEARNAPTPAPRPSPTTQLARSLTMTNDR